VRRFSHGDDAGAGTAPFYLRTPKKAAIDAAIAASMPASSAGSPIVTQVVPFRFWPAGCHWGYASTESEATCRAYRRSGSFAKFPWLLQKKNPL
jgi:hypothetical protein